MKSTRTQSARGRSQSLNRLATERLNPASVGIDRKSSLEIARLINSEDTKVAAAVRQALPTIAKAIDAIADSLGRGGRLIYVGAGTSGRIAALDCVELPPTYGADPKSIQFVIAGGKKALSESTEDEEDSQALGERGMAKKKPGKKDIVVGVAASGRTPFTIAALLYARRKGARTVAVTCNHNSPLGRAAHFDIVTEVGPEVVSGSTRMKAGSAQKMVLNTLSSGAMIRLGYVYNGWMVNLQLRNEKLLERGLAILQTAAQVSRVKARQILQSAGNRIPVALVMLKADVNCGLAARALKEHRGHVRNTIASLLAL